jgi:hypothetical protein
LALELERMAHHLMAEADTWVADHGYFFLAEVGILA